MWVYVLGLRHAQILGLPSGYLAVQLRVAEQRRTGALFAVLRCLTLALQAFAAHEAVSTGDVERNHHSITDLEITCLSPDLLDNAHRLVTEHVARRHERAENFVQVEVGPADVGAGDLDDRVGRLLDDRVGNRFDRDLSPALPGDRSHEPSSCRV